MIDRPDVVPIDGILESLLKVIYGSLQFLDNRIIVSFSKKKSNLEFFTKRNVKGKRTKKGTKVCYYS